MASRFAVGVAVGLGGSFAILQRTTDRRIISWLMRIDDEQKSASIYKYRLYREMSDFARPIKEGATEQKDEGYLEFWSKFSEQHFQFHWEHLAWLRQETERRRRK